MGRERARTPLLTFQFAPGNCVLNDFTFHWLTDTVEKGRITIDEGFTVNSLMKKTSSGLNAVRSIFHRPHVRDRTPHVLTSYMEVQLRPLFIMSRSFGVPFLSPPEPFMLTTPICPYIPAVAYLEPSGHGVHQKEHFQFSEH